VHYDPARDTSRNSVSAVSNAVERVLLDGDGMSRTLSRIAHEVIERNPDLERVALVGIHTRGVPLAHRLGQLIEERAGVEVPLDASDHTVTPRAGGEGGA